MMLQYIRSHCQSELTSLSPLCLMSDKANQGISVELVLRYLGKTGENLCSQDKTFIIFFNNSPPSLQKPASQPQPFSKLFHIIPVAQKEVDPCAGLRALLFFPS